MLCFDKNERTCYMLKKLIILSILLFPMVADAAPKNKKKEEPVVHLTDEQIYQELKKQWN